MQPISVWKIHVRWTKASHCAGRVGEPPTSLAWSAYKKLDPLGLAGASWRSVVRRDDRLPGRLNDFALVQPLVQTTLGMEQ